MAVGHAEDSSQGDFTVTSALTVSGTGYVQLPSGTTAQRPTPAAGMIRWNSDNSEFEGYDGSDWRGLILSAPVV